MERGREIIRKGAQTIQEHGTRSSKVYCRKTKGRVKKVDERQEKGQARALGKQKEKKTSNSILL